MVARLAAVHEAVAASDETCVNRGTACLPVNAEFVPVICVLPFFRRKLQVSLCFGPS